MVEWEPMEGVVLHQLLNLLDPHYCQVRERFLLSHFEILWELVAVIVEVCGQHLKFGLLFADVLEVLDDGDECEMAYMAQCLLVM